MTDNFFQKIDWSRPWFKPHWAMRDFVIKENWRCLFNEIASTRHLRAGHSKLLQFVPQDELPSQVKYELFIYESGKVPTRENLHDFFNALIWLNLPCSKRELNLLHTHELVKQGSVHFKGSDSKPRGHLRDAGTIFDENGVIFITARPDLYQLLKAHAWKELFLESRTEFQNSSDVWIFGHALMEKLVSPYKAITGHALPVIVDQSFYQKPLIEKRKEIDSKLKELLTEQLRMTAFSPIPVLGIPGWWEGQDASFYEDIKVFRPQPKRDVRK